MSASDDKIRAFKLVREQIDALGELRNSGPRDQRFKLWRQNMVTLLQRFWPNEPARAERFRRIPFSPPLSRADRTGTREYFERGCAEVGNFLSELLVELEGIPIPTAGDFRGVAGPEPAAVDPVSLLDLTAEISGAGAELTPSRPDAPAPPADKAESAPTREPWKGVVPSPGKGSAAPRLKDLLGFTDQGATGPFPGGQAPIPHEPAAPPPAPVAPAASMPPPPPPPSNMVRSEPPAPVREDKVEPPSEAFVPEPPRPTVAPVADPAIDFLRGPSGSKAKPEPKPETGHKSKLKARTEAKESKRSRSAPPRPTEPAAPPPPPPSKAAPAPLPPSKPAPPPPPKSAPPPQVGPPPLPKAAPAPLPPPPPPPMAAPPPMRMEPAPMKAVEPPAPIRAPGPPPVGPPALPTDEILRPAEPSLAAQTILSLASDVEILGVVDGQQAIVRAALIDLARQIQTPPVRWEALRQTISFAIEYPQLAKQILPLIVPHLDEAA